MKKEKVVEAATVASLISVQQLAERIIKNQNLGKQSKFSDIFKAIKKEVTDDVIALVHGGFTYNSFVLLLRFIFMMIENL